MNTENLAFYTFCRSLPAILMHELYERLIAGAHWRELRSWLFERAPAFDEITREQVADRICEIRHWQQKGFRLIVPGDPGYPETFRLLSHPVRYFFVLSDQEIGSDPKLSVVGSREPSSLSLSWIESELGQFCAESQVCIVSGGARGVDQAAHRAAIQHGCRTLVFLPSGLSHIYPESLVDWVGPVMKLGGAFISEYLPSSPLRRSHFVERNRLIAAVSIATLLIEARPRSGTLLTARSAIEQNKPLWILPSHPFDFNARGGLDLITEGAAPVRDAEDLKLYFQSEIFPLTLKACANAPLQERYPQSVECSQGPDLQM